MSLTASEKGSSYKPAPPGTHLAICRQVVDLGTQFSTFYHKSQHKIMVGWELPDEKTEDGRPFTVLRRYTLSLGKNSTLRAHLEAWRGRPFTSEELRGFDMHNILDKPCMVSISHDERDGQTYANVAAVMACPKGTIVPKPTNPTVSFDIEKWDEAAYQAFPDWLKKVLDASEERKGKQLQAMNGVGGKPAADTGPIVDDDIPF